VHCPATRAAARGTISSRDRCGCATRLCGVPGNAPAPLLRCAPVVPTSRPRPDTAGEFGLYSVFAPLPEWGHRPHARTLAHCHANWRPHSGMPAKTRGGGNSSAVSGTPARPGSKNNRVLPTAMGPQPPASRISGVPANTSAALRDRALQMPSVREGGLRVSVAVTSVARPPPGRSRRAYRRQNWKPR
jgi:hypothetical protein